MHKTLIARFMSKFTPEPNSGCWLWDAGINNHGYGLFWANSQQRTAHRVAYTLFKGDIPPGDGPHGTCVLHKCDVRSCVNPDHLFLGSNLDNINDMTVKGRNKLPVDGLPGEKNKNAKLDAHAVLKIRGMYSAGLGSYQTIGSLFGVDGSTIGRIVRRVDWQHI